MKERLEIDNRIAYEFSDEEEYQGKKFVSFKKITIFKDQKKYQNLTIKPEHWAAFEEWILEKCFTGEILYRPPRGTNINPIGDDSVPF